MSSGSRFVAPAISDADIPRVCAILGLPVTAFGGLDGRDPRLQVLKSLETLDVASCPGSGKTTLLVAKLALLSSRWTDPRAGMCVLSHTNVARREIESRLGNTAEGRRLLSYPHFVGTIHGFVNGFLAVPWLKSLGYAIEMIDDEVTQRRRWNKLPRSVKAGLEKNRYNQGILKIRSVDFSVGDIRWGKGALGRATPTYTALRDSCRASADEGYFCHDEMFMWAYDLVEKAPEVVDLLRARFPLLFTDEAQDNSEMQSKLLHRIFMDGDEGVMRHRFGDANQAIYQYAGQTEGAETDPFPGSRVTQIPNSFRFGQEIADLADPLALEPQGLQGRRQIENEAESDTSGKHAIFLFEEGNVDRVLEAYGRYLITVFSRNELKNGTFTAIGAVRQPKGDDKIPWHVGHYWPAYDYENSRRDPHPRTFVQYIRAGRLLSEESGESHMSVEKIAEAVMQLARLMSPNFNTARSKRKHRYVADMLRGTEAATAYLNLVRDLALERRPIMEGEWNENFRPVVVAIAQELAGSEADDSDVRDFLAWSASPAPPMDNERQRHGDNIFRYPAEDPTVEVRVGSIHAAKGETHTATLVLETFYRKHHLQVLKSWLCGEKAGGSGGNATLQSRLKIHYVAMTRPSRLLCLAMRKDSLGQHEITELTGRGWRVARVTSEGEEWLGAGVADPDGSN